MDGLLYLLFVMDAKIMRIAGDNVRFERFVIDVICVNHVRQLL